VEGGFVEDDVGESGGGQTEWLYRRADVRGRPGGIDNLMALLRLVDGVPQLATQRLNSCGDAEQNVVKYLQPFDPLIKFG
jgi:hypothetical protein